MDGSVDGSRKICKCKLKVQTVRSVVKIIASQVNIFSSKQRVCAQEHLVHFSSVTPEGDSKVLYFSSSATVL